MNDNQWEIEDFINAVHRQLAGSDVDRVRTVDQLREHLMDAKDAGELTHMLERLGDPQAVAEGYAKERPLPEAAIVDRMIAAAIDNLPLIAVAIGLLIQDILSGSGSIRATFPPFVYAEIPGFDYIIAAIPPTVQYASGNGCMMITPLPSVCGIYHGSMLLHLGLPLALTWSIIGLAFLESRTASTPGKHLMGLQTVTITGIKASLTTTILRRLSFLLGPLAWLDWSPLLWNDRRRILDLLVGTRVVTLKEV